MTGVTFKLGLREYCVVYYSPWGLGISLILVASSLQVVHHSENNIDITFLSCGSRMCDFHPLNELCLLNLSVGEGNGTPPQYSCWKIPWTEEPGRLQSMGSRRDRHNWATSLSLFIFMHWRRKWQPTPVFLPGESQGRRSLVGCRLWDHTESDTTEVTSQQQQQSFCISV